MSESLDTFVRNLRQHCAVHSLSQAQVARNYNHSPTIIGHYFNGRHAPSEGNEASLASALGVSRNTLREWLGRPPTVDPDADDLDRTMVELRPLLDPMPPARRRAVVSIVREIAQL